MMVLGGLQAGMAVHDYQKAADAAHDAKGLATQAYKDESAGAAAEGAAMSRQQGSKSKVLGALGGAGRQLFRTEGEDINLDVALLQQGAKSEYLSRLGQVDESKRQSRYNALSGMIQGATLMTQGIMGGPKNKATGKRVYDPLWGGLGHMFGFWDR